MRLCCSSLEGGRCSWGADAGTDRVGDRCFVSVSNVCLTSALGSSHSPLWLVLRADSQALSSLFVPRQHVRVVMHVLFDLAVCMDMASIVSFTGELILTRPV